MRRKVPELDVGVKRRVGEAEILKTDGDTRGRMARHA